MARPCQSSYQEVDGMKTPLSVGRLLVVQKRYRTEKFLAKIIQFFHPIRFLSTTPDMVTIRHGRAAGARSTRQHRRGSTAAAGHRWGLQLRPAPDRIPSSGSLCRVCQCRQQPRRRGSPGRRIEKERFGPRKRADWAPRFQGQCACSRPRAPTRVPPGPGRLLRAGSARARLRPASAQEGDDPAAGLVATRAGPGRCGCWPASGACES